MLKKEIRGSRVILREQRVGDAAFFARRLPNDA